MVQDRTSGLAIISINHINRKELSYDDVIDDFAAKKARKQKFQRNTVRITLIPIICLSYNFVSR